MNALFDHSILLIPEKLLISRPLYYGDYLQTTEIIYKFPPRGRVDISSHIYHQYRIFEQQGIGYWSSNHPEPDLKKGFDNALQNSATSALFKTDKKEVFYPFSHKSEKLNAPLPNRDNMIYLTRLIKRGQSLWRRYSTSLSATLIYREHFFVSSSGSRIWQNSTSLSYVFNGKRFNLRDHIPIKNLNKNLISKPKLPFRLPPKGEHTLFLAPSTLGALLNHLIKQGEKPLFDLTTHPALAGGLQADYFDDEGSRREPFELKQFHPGNIFSKKSHGNTFYNFETQSIEFRYPDLLISQGQLPIGSLLNHAIVIANGDQFSIEDGIVQFRGNLIYYRNQRPRSIYSRHIKIPLKQILSGAFTKEREIIGFEHHSIKTPYLLLDRGLNE